MDRLADFWELRSILVQTPAFALRPGRLEDYAFAECLCFETSKPLLESLGSWNPDWEAGRLREAFDPTEVVIIILGDIEIGWMQTKETKQNIHLCQLHLIERLRSRGIGSALVRALIRRATDSERVLSLSVLRNNPARALYRRLGFEVIGFNREKLHMQHSAGDAPDLRHPAVLKTIAHTQQSRTSATAP